MAKGKMIEAFIKSTYDGKGAKEAKKDLNDLKSSGKDTNNTMSKLFDAGKIGLFAKGLSTAAGKIGQLAKKSSDYIETLNVLDVAFDSNTDSIRKFTSAISETLNLDEASIIKMAGAFKTLANSLGYSNEVGGEFAELMTKVTLDASSLYNLSLDKSRSMLQSAIMGRGQSLAKTGANVLESTVQGILDKLNIDAEIESMNGAEKAMARTIAIIYQLQNAQGDLARTIETPANQFRVLGEQISQVGRNIGNVFLPMIDAILPYLNAVLIVVNKLIASLAALVGFREDKWDVYSGKTSNLADAFDDLGASVGGVGSAAKETKKQLMGLRSFDKLNVIKTPRPASGSGGAGGGGINKNLLDAFNKLAGNYDLGLAGIETRATKIAKKIMKALGDIDFTNLINSGKRLWEAFKPFAQNVGQGLLWAFDNILKPLAKWTITDLLPTFLDTLANCFKILNNAIETFKPIGDWLWKNFLSPLAKWTGGMIVSTLKNFRDVLELISKSKIASTITTAATAFLLFKTSLKNAKDETNKSKGVFGALKTILKNLLSPIGKLGTSLKVAKGETRDLTKELKPQNTLWGTFKTKITNAGKAVKNLGTFKDKLKTKISQTSTEVKNGIALWQNETTVIEKAQTALLGIVGMATSLRTLSDAMKDVSENGLNMSNGLQVGLSTVGSIATGALTGASALANLGVGGAAIGAAIGGFAALGTAITTHFLSKKDPIEEAIDSYKKKMQELDEQAHINLETDMVQIEHKEKLVQELDGLVDSNGRVKASDEERVNYILNELNNAFGTEYKLIDGVITKNGEQVDSLDEIHSAIEKNIRIKKAEAIQNAYADEYSEALKHQKKAVELVNEAEKKHDDNLADIEFSYQQAMKAGDKFGNAAEIRDQKLINESKRYKDELKKIDKSYKDSNQLVTDLDNLREAALSGNIEKTDKLMEKFLTSNGKTYDTAMKEAEEKSKTTSNNIKGAYSTLEDKKYTINIDANTTPATNKMNNFFNSFNNKKISKTLSLQADGGILVNGKWRDIAKYDTGGLPPVGQMFVARERGPELVGNIGGHTAVMNNNQIVSSVSSGVAQAVRSVMGNTNNGGVYNIYLDKDHKLGSYTLEQLQGMAKSNGKPITIG